MTTATEALEAWNRLDSKDGLGPALHVGQMLADALTSLSRASALSTPPADDVREAVIRELHPDYPSPIPALNQLYEDHADRFLDRFEVCPRGTVTDDDADDAVLESMIRIALRFDLDRSPDEARRLAALLTPHVLRRMAAAREARS